MGRPVAAVWMVAVAVLSLVPAAAGEDGADDSTDLPAAERREYRALLEEDDHALAQIDQWIVEFQGRQAAEDDELGISKALLEKRIEQRMQKLEKAYRGFLEKYPDHVDAHIAFGSLLSDQNRMEEAREQWQIAAGLAPDNPVPWNNLATYHGHNGPVKKAFEYYEKAIALRPDESLYYHNFGTTVYLFRKDAMEYFGIDEQAVFDKAFDLYRRAMELDPKDFPLASDVAQSYYIPKPFRMKAAVAAWKHALSIAENEKQRQGVYLHLARCLMLGGEFDAARNWLEKVNDPFYTALKERIVRAVTHRETAAANDGG